MDDLTCNFDHRYPSYNTVTPTSRYGFLPLGSYMFTREGSVHNYCSGMDVREQSPHHSSFSRPSFNRHALFTAHLQGPRYGATMGACVPRAVQSSLIDYTAEFIPPRGGRCSL